MTRVTLFAPDMTCGHCEATVRRTLGRESAVASIDVDLSKHHIGLAFDPSATSVDHLCEVLSEAGYDASVVS